MTDRMMIAAMMAQGILAKPDTGLAPPFPKTDDLSGIALEYADGLMARESGLSPSPARPKVREVVPNHFTTKEWDALVDRIETSTAGGTEATRIISDIIEMCAAKQAALREVGNEH